MAFLSTSSTRDGDRIVLTCSGSAESEALEALQTARETAHASATSGSVRSVVADFRALEFARSLGALAAFAGEIVEIQTEAM